ncbi:hypothetical protein [Burkholderia diffusa]|uniref:hypothetical protein n=1 Tax=Burkholderia diffusa TaxID=488732 RepID=UPI0007557FEE|nr:hypothetical protein [Burkholderia diffusa]KVH51206.1 hypothetical protein WJ39_08630 [Burkholderia diffusa]
MDAISTIAEDFDEYAQHVLADAPEPVREFAQTAFYAGAGAVLDAVDKISRTADKPVAGVAAMKRLREEFSDFVRERLARSIANALGVSKLMMVDVRIERRSATDPTTGAKD